jgi:hypothetical protein
MSLVADDGDASVDADTVNNFTNLASKLPQQIPGRMHVRPWIGVPGGVVRTPPGPMRTTYGAQGSLEWCRDDAEGSFFKTGEASIEDG